MSTITFQEKLNEVYSKTSNVFAEQEAKNYEEEVNTFLDFISECREGFLAINRDYEELLESFSAELAGVFSKKELIILRERATPLYTLSKKLIKTTNSNSGCRMGLKTVLNDFQLNVADLHEILRDIEKRLHENKDINSLLSEIADYNH